MEASSVRRRGASAPPDTPAFASLPWYDLPEIAPATDSLWRRLAAALRSLGVSRVPAELDRETHFERQWQSHRLLFSQACGYDVLFACRNRLRLVATPRYAAPGCSGSNYSSFIIVRDQAPYEQLEDLRGRRCVINSATSHSGMNLLRSLAAPLHRRGRFFSAVEVSGAHEYSLGLVRSGKADVAAIDCVTYALLDRYRPEALSGTRILCRRGRVPAPPYVTSAGSSDRDIERLRAALCETLADPAMSSVKDALLIDSVEILPLEAYEPIAEIAFNVFRLGYSEIP